MTTGQTPKRRETDDQAAARAAELEKRAQDNTQRPFKIKAGSLTYPPKIDASGRLLN